jgi:hypothetical protein
MLKQIRENRSSLKLRPDHWVPFSVLTGIPDNSAQKTLFDLTAPKPLIHGPLPKYRLPLRPDAASPLLAEKRTRLKGERNFRPLDKSLLWQPWTIPQDVKQKTVMLCRALNETDVQELLHSKSLESTSSKSTLSSSTPQQTANPSSHIQTESPLSLTMYWERDEYRYVIEERSLLDEGEKLVWPSFVQHARLELFRNRYPKNLPFNVFPSTIFTRKGLRL